MRSLVYMARPLNQGFSIGYSTEYSTDIQLDIEYSTGNSHEMRGSAAGGQHGRLCGQFLLHNTNSLRIWLGGAREAKWPIPITILIQIHCKSASGRLVRLGGRNAM